MKPTEIKEGQVFTISETPSYPKMKTRDGYIDMRDKIINNSDNWHSADLRIMTKEEIMKRFDATVQEIDDWINSFEEYM
jgi:hypothetical protein